MRRQSKACPADLTTAQWAYLQCIRRMSELYGFAPTYAEIADDMSDKGTGAIERAFRACAKLENLGYITRQSRSARTMRLTPKGLEAL
jgi:SOS-response transcriptional repressor LexA